MENIDKGLTVPKWVLKNWPKIPQMPQNFDEKGLHWVSVVRITISETCFVTMRCPQYNFLLIDLLFVFFSHHI